jgi:hypothetical protein
MTASASTPSATYLANKHKTFHSILCDFLQTEFPKTFGPAITRLFADRIQELYEHCHPPLQRVHVGQVLWLAVAADELPGRNKRMQNTRLLPILLDLVTAEDIHEAAATGQRLQTRRKKILRLFRQAFDQGAVLSQADVGLLLHLDASTISGTVLDHERSSGEVIPRRGTIHDLGRSISHKAVICYKRLVEKKATSQVAQETFHSPEEVEYYVQCFRRIQLCRDNGMSVEDIALATGHSQGLVQEYLDLLQEFGLPPLPNPCRKDGVQADHQ